MLLLRFEIPKNKLLEFNLAHARMVKWPVYALHDESNSGESKTFEIIRSWENEEEKQKELQSQVFANLVGAVKVLGHIQESHIYYIAGEENLRQVLEY